MYTFSNRLKIGSIALMIIGIAMVSYGFYDSHKSLEDVKVMLAEEATAHDGGHVEATHAEPTLGDEGHAVVAEHGESQVDADAHNGDEHAEHVMHQIHNRPYSALYVAAFFFMMIALGV